VNATEPRRLVRSITVKRIIPFVICACVTAPSAAVAGQDSPPSPPPSAKSASAQAGPQIPLKVQLIVSKYSGEKKISSVPYTLSVVANDNDRTSLRVGMDVPIPATVFGAAKEGGTATVPQMSFNYRPIGTDIDCAARTIEGYFKLDLAVSDRSLVVLEKGTAGLPNTVVRTFTSTFNVLLRDGQTAQHTAATDPVSGEVLRIDVTLNVLK
jgi:hypothetical protein